MSREFHLINTGKIRKLFRQILNIRKKNKKIFIKDNYVLAKIQYILYNCCIQETMEKRYGQYTIKGTCKD